MSDYHLNYVAELLVLGDLLI